MIDNTETISLRATVIGGDRCADDYTVTWRSMPIWRDIDLEQWRDCESVHHVVQH